MATVEPVVDDSFERWAPSESHAGLINCWAPRARDRLCPDCARTQPS